MRMADAYEFFGLVQKLNEPESTWAETLDQIKLALTNDTRRIQTEALITEASLFLLMVRALLNVTLSDNAEKLLIIFSHALRYNNGLVLQKQTALSPLDSPRGLRTALLRILDLMKTKASTVELALRCLSDVQACEAGFQWASKDIAFRTIEKVIDCSRRHALDSSVREQLCVFLANLSATGTVEIRRHIFSTAGTLLILCASFATNPSSLNPRLADCALSALHNLCFDDPDMALDLFRLKALDAAQKVLQVFEIQRETALAALTILADIAIIAGPDLILPVHFVKLAYDMARQHASEELYVIASTKALERMTKSEEGQREFL